MLAYALTDTFYFNATPTTEIYTLSLHDALPIYGPVDDGGFIWWFCSLGKSCAAHSQDQTDRQTPHPSPMRSEEHTSELQSRLHLVCRLLLEKKKSTPPMSNSTC